MAVQKFKKIERGIRKKEVSQVEISKKGIERAPEKIIERERIKIDKKPEISVPVLVSEEIAKSAPTPAKDDITIQIEKVLEEDLEEVYFNMPPEKKKEFRQKGEETASRIRKLLESIKIKTVEIVKLITNWLKIIPGVNRFFIEQETKIKVDKILNIKNPK